MTDSLAEFGAWAKAWLFDAALPLWCTTGLDREGGGFHEKIAQDGQPVPAAKRIRVQARQIFVYATAGRLGWDGPWRAAAEHALDFLRTAYRRPDGFYRTAAAGGGHPGSDAVDLYDQAFVLFALAAAHERGIEPDRALEEARDLLGRLTSDLKHPAGGFEEARPRQLPLRSNPHMHLLEATLAWTARDVDPRFRAMAEEIARLALTRLIDPESGSIGEYYDGDWRFAEGDAGRVREPGHQYEWAYLLGEAERHLGIAAGGMPARLLGFAERCGVRKRLAIFSTDAHGNTLDGSARLWAQTERLRAMLLLGGADGAPAAVEAADALRRYLDVPVRGLWTDRVTADGKWVSEPAPASSLYHIVTALVPLMERAGG